MANHLARLASGFGKTHAIDRIIQSLFKQLKQGLTRDAFSTGSFYEVFTELAFKKTIDPFDLLFFTQLKTILGVFPAFLSMLTGGISSTLESAFFSLASGTL